MATASDWLLEALAGTGVRHLFGNPGSTELPLMDALPRQTAVRYVLGLHEMSVIGMADGYAQAGGGLAVANVHVQPGLANALAAILNAARARVPMVVTVGQQVTSMLAGAPFLGGELVKMAEPLAKAAWEVPSADRLPEMLATAIRTATGHPRGPVVLSLPVDVQAGPAPDGALPSIRPEDPPVPDAHGIARAAAILAAAEAPAILAGDGVAHERGEADLVRLAERLGATILGEPFASRVPIPSGHPLWAGPLPGFASEIRRRLAPHDVVLAVGMPVFRLFGPSDGPALPPGTRLVHLDPDPAEIGRLHAPEVGLVGGVAAGLRALDRAVGRSPGASARRARAAAAVASERAATRARSTGAAGESVTAPVFCRAIAGAVGARDIVVEEALTTGRPLRALLPRRPGSWLAHRGSALGWGLPAAVGAKLARPDRRVMCLHGDGSLLFGIHALWTAANAGAPVAVVVADNGGYEILRAGLEGLTGQVDSGWPGLRIEGPAIDIPAICAGFGASVAAVSAPGDLPEALRDLWERAADRPAVLVVRVAGRAAPVGYPVG